MQINYSDLARTYGVTKLGPDYDPNAGATVKEFLLDHNIDVLKFKQHRHTDVPPKPRRKIIRTGGSETMMPLPPANDQLRKEIKMKIESGEYVLGELIVPRKYTKFVVKEDGTLKPECFTVSGRKIPLMEIRKRLLQKHQALGLMRDHADSHYAHLSEDQIRNRLQELGEDEPNNNNMEALKAKLCEIERTRHLMVWLDNSCILNHGHHLIMVAAMYDPAFYLTSDEMEVAGKGKLDVHNVVETPHIYILGRCTSSEAEKIAYSETRQEDLAEMKIKIPTEKRNEVRDIMRFFKGDGPEQQFESGEMKGGKSGGCGSCDAVPTRWSDLAYCFMAQHQTVEYRRQKVLAGPAGRESRNGGLKPFHGMSTNELTRELKARKLNSTGSKPVLEARLREELGGIQRVPALLFGCQEAKLADLNLENYEIACSEPLHDIKEHIKNITTELPYHLTEDEKIAFNEHSDNANKSKVQMRGSDYRLLAVTLCSVLRGKVRPKVQLLLDTLTEISHLLYLPPETRCPRLVLRLYNITFLHSILCKEVVGVPKKLTARKFYGKYFHSLSCHTPALARIVSLSTINTEDEERTFNALTNISRQTSSRRPGEIVGNSIIRYQAECKLNDKGATVRRQQSRVSEASRSLPEFPNTTFSKDFMQHHRSDYQAHLQRLGDFLLPGEGVWWTMTESGVEFRDSDREADRHISGPLLHHFRSSNEEKEKQYQKCCWDDCIEKKVSIPHSKIRVYDNDGNPLRTVHNERLATHTNAMQQATSQEIQTIAESEEVPEEISCNDCGIELVVQNEEEEFPPIIENNQSEAVEAESPGACSSLDEVETSLVAQQDIVMSNMAKHDNEKLQKHDASNSTLPVSNNHEASPAVSPAVHHETEMEQPIALSNNQLHPKEKQDKHPQQLQTNIAKHVSYVLGNTNKVQHFDHLRDELHRRPNSKDLIQRYENDLAAIQHQVLCRHEQLKRAIKQWEEEYFLKHNCSDPTVKELQSYPQMHQKYKQYIRARELLKHWHITLHK